VFADVLLTKLPNTREGVQEQLLDANTTLMVTGGFNASWEPTWDASLAPTKLRDGHLSPGFLDTNTKKQHLTVKVGQRCVTLAPILYTPILYTPN